MHTCNTNKFVMTAITALVATRMLMWMVMILIMTMVVVVDIIMFMMTAEHDGGHH